MSDYEDINNATNEVILSWSLTNNGSPPAEEYILIITPSPPSFTSPLSTNNTTAKLTLNKDTNYTVDVTALTCVGNITTRHTISCAECLKISSTEESNTTKSCTDNTCTSVSSLSTMPEPTTNTIARGLRDEHIAAIAGVSALFVCILFVVVICAIILVSRKKPVKAENGVADTGTVQMDAGYSHFGFHTQASADIQQEEEYSTLNLPKPPGKQKIKSNYEQKEKEDCYDYCTIGGAIQTDTKPKPPEMSGSYALIGHDQALEKDVVRKKERKKGTVNKKIDTQVEYAEVQVKTKLEDNLLNLDCVLILIRDVASKWEELANEFCTPKDEIDHIRKTTCEDYDRLVEVCDWWIKRLYEKNSQPTWRALSKALKRIGYADLAKEIMGIYKTGKLPERVNAGPDVPDVLASIAAGSSSNTQANPPPLPPHTASATTPATPSAFAIAPESTYDDVKSAAAKSIELTAPPLPPPISLYDDTIVNETPPPLPPPLSSYDDTVVNKAPPISAYSDITENGGPPLPPKHF